MEWSKGLREESWVWLFTPHTDTEVGQDDGRATYVWASKPGLRASEKREAGR